MGTRQNAEEHLTDVHLNVPKAITEALGELPILRCACLTCHCYLARQLFSKEQSQCKSQEQP